MKFLVTAIAMSRATRRRAGKAWTEIVEYACDHPLAAEERFEREYNLNNPHGSCKVVDIREVRDETSVAFLPLPDKRSKDDV